MNELKANIYIKNLNSIARQFELINEFAAFWSVSREDFFSKLALWLEENIGASEISIIFNDLKPLKGEEDKPQLTKSLLTKVSKLADNNESKLKGEEEQEEAWQKSTPEESHLALFTEYESTLTLCPRLLELGEDSLTIGGSLTKSPFLIICKFKYCDSLQQSLMKGLFGGLNNFLTL